MEIQTKIHIDYRVQDILSFILSEHFVKVADTKDIQPSHMKEVQVDGEIICVVNVEGKYFAINNICTHEGGPLADGTLEGYEVECPWHGSKFDVRTGDVKNPPATEPEPTYEVKIVGTDILLKKRTPGAESDSNRNLANIIFKKEFDQWANMNKNLKIVYSITEEEKEERSQTSSSSANEWKGERGRIDKAMLTRYLSTEDLSNSIYYTCGPPGMIKAMQTLLQDDLQISKERIKVEEFTGY